MFSKLESFEISEDSTLTEIAANAFMATAKLTEIYLPNTLNKIGDTNIASKNIHLVELRLSGRHLIIQEKRKFTF